MSEMDSNFGGEASSIYFEDSNAADQLSKIILNNTSENEGAKILKELEEKNELKMAYKNKENLPDNVVRENYNDQVRQSTQKQYESNIGQNIQNKVESNQLEEQDVLPIEDFPENPIAEKFIYDEAIDKIRTIVNLYEEEFNKININSFKRENIYKGKGVEIMVEETYGFDKYLKNKMIEDICYLKRIMNSWRRVAGDGNCFYRSVIFSWLEYLIFNKKITILQIVIANLYTKFDPKYPKTKELPYNIKSQFVTEERYLVIAVLEIIIRYLMKNKIIEAYLLLLKAFNVTRVFDRIMIFYLRYLLYEYICDNKTKLYTKDFPVVLGNLLPAEYERDDGKFLYDEYFKMDLLKFYTCAEKLAVYLVPFVLKINLNIVFYYFGNECVIENKFISCFLANKDKKKDTINVLYRKAHYDVSYTQEYYNDFQPLLDLYKEKGNNCYIVDAAHIKQKENFLNEHNPYNPEMSVVYNQILFEKKQKEKEKGTDKKKKETEKYEIVNDFCEDQDVNADVIINGIKKKHSLNSCFICDKDINNNAVKNTSLGCKCNILLCSEICKETYYKSLCLFFDSMDFNVNIKCGTCEENVNRTNMVEKMAFDEEKSKNSFKKRMFEYFGKYCMNCATLLKGKKCKIIKCKCQQLKKLLDSDKFDHHVCEECSKKSISTCKICGFNFYHKKFLV